jgi:RNA polymerase sigma-70 factor (ECF subfamily)
MNESDATLVARIQGGDAAAFEILMRRHYRFAFLIAFAQVQNRHDAEDVCQDAFVRCWERIGDCRHPARASAWIGAVVRNMAQNRREYLAVRRAEPVEAAGNVAASERADAAVERSELRAKIGAALARLQLVQREVVLLHDFEGWRHDEIAERLGISVLMSRRHLSDARRRLRVQLGALVTSTADHD